MTTMVDNDTIHKAEIKEVIGYLLGSEFSSTWGEILFMLRLFVLETDIRVLKVFFSFLLTFKGGS